MLALRSYETEAISRPSLWISHDTEDTWPNTFVKRAVKKIYNTVILRTLARCMTLYDNN